MKKIIILFLAVLFLTGCNNKMSIVLSNVQNIKYNNITLLDGDYFSVVNNINESEFSTKPISASYKEKLIITTENDIYVFDISDKSIKYNKDDKDYYAANTTVLGLLSTIEEDYLYDSFYEISKLDKYEKNDNDLYLKLDNGDNYYVITTSNVLYDFKVNQIVEDVDKLDRPVFNEVNLLYENKQLTDRQIVIRTSESIKISFTNKYNFETTIIPIDTTEGLIFNKTYRQK